MKTHMRLGKDGYAAAFIACKKSGRKGQSKGVIGGGLSPKSFMEQPVEERCKCCEGVLNQRKAEKVRKEKAESLRKEQNQ